MQHHLFIFSYVEKEGSFFGCFKETIEPEFLFQKHYYKREISKFIIYKQTLAFLFLLDYNRLV